MKSEAQSLEQAPPKTSGWVLREILRLYTYPFVLLAWVLVPPLRSAVVRYMRGSQMVWRVFVEPFRAANAEARATAAGERGPLLDKKVVGVLITSALCMVMIEYVAMSNRTWVVQDALRLVGLSGLAEVMASAMRDPLNRLIYWAVGCSTFYFVVPAIVIRFIFRERLSDYGMGLRGAFKDAWIYILFFGTVAPAIAFVSFDPHFQSTYPFYDVSPGEPLWPRFWTWEILYFIQFFALEFFFRGFMVHGTRHRLGYSSVLVMMVPYCMIHFGKPLPETLGAIIAGVVLGSLSLKSRSIWMGVAIHASVALSMDFASLWQKGLLR